VLDGRGIDLAPDPQGAPVLGEKHGDPNQLPALAALPEREISGGEDPSQSGEVGEGIRFLAERLPRAQIASVAVDPECIAVELGQAADIDGHHHQAHRLALGAAADRADQIQGHELAGILDPRKRVDADAADHDPAGLHAQAGFQKLLTRSLRELGRRMPQKGLFVSLQPEALLTFRAEKEDLHDIGLIVEDLVYPARVAGTGEVDLVVVSLLAEKQARLRELREKPYHLAAARQVLIQVAEICAEVLQVGLLVDERGALQHQRKIEKDRDQ